MKETPVRESIAIWWKIDSHRVGFTPVKVVAFTAGYVTFLSERWGYVQNTIVERREKRTDIFPNFAEAKAEAVRRISDKVERAKQSLHEYRSELGQWQSINEPKP